MATMPMTATTGPDRNKSRPAFRSGAGQYLINQEKLLFFWTGRRSMFFEQKSDEIGFTDANKNFIMSYDMSSINWTSDKQFLPENVYKRYMECWGNHLIYL